MKTFYGKSRPIPKESIEDTTKVAYKIKVPSDYYRDRYVDGMILHMGVNGWQNIKEFKMQKKLVYKKGTPTDQWFEATVIVNKNDLIDYNYAAISSGNFTWHNNDGKDYHRNVGKGNTEMMPKIPVNFTVYDAYTVVSENVYLCGNADELGNWSASLVTDSAVCDSYPTWKYIVKLVPGQIIQYKAVIKDANGSCRWENGDNHTYTVPFSGVGTVDFTWQN